MIRAILVDDEQPALDKLEKLLKISDMAEVVGKFTEPCQALEFLESNKADAAFLDIEMPDIDGIELSTHILSLQEKIAVIFVTAYSQYAVEAFRLNALDYLLKPVTFDRLKETLCRITEEKGAGTYAGEVSIRCFGEFRVAVGKDEIKFRTGKAEELLAYFIDREEGFTSRREIIDALWEDFEGDKALINFNTTLHYVKKALLFNGCQLSVTHDRGSYRLDTKGIDCDYLNFKRFIAKTDPISIGSISACEEAASLYTGDYLADREYDWAERKRLLLKEQYINLLLGISEYYIKSGSLTKAADRLKHGLLHEPFHRELNYKLIEALIANNDCISALKYFELYKSGLDKKFGQEPDEAFDRLF